MLAADGAEAHGLVVPTLSGELRDRLRRLVPGAASADNPLDLGAGATPAAFATTAEAIAGSGEVDALVLIIIGTKANAPDEILDALAGAVDADPGLPVAAVVIGGGDRPTLGNRAVPVYPMPERAVTALGHAAAYGAWRRAPLGRRPDLGGIDAARARSVVQAVRPGWQSYEGAAAILSAYGIPLTTTVTAYDATAAVIAAETAGYPVVLKSADPDLVHKTDTGGVALGLTDADAVRAAFDRVAAAGRPAAGVLVQHQVKAPIELVAGLVHDPVFGSVVMVGLGGVHTDVLGDRALRLVPLTDLDAGRMWRDLRSAPLLRGHRGDPPVDTAAVEDLLLRLGRLAEDLPEVAELDLNPVLAGPDGVVAVDAKLRLAPVGAEPDPVLRRLAARDA
ncbi:acetate--CoA ligase family protein [Actinoplanes sp. NPDC049265]|uniref:acetate--CoA ligase family protein n=1 Tax=Actinoplanes sp. NPDC049265 TaxID=3363902 RepID=UPI003714DF62